MTSFSEAYKQLSIKARSRKLIDLNYDKIIQKILLFKIDAELFMFFET